MIIFNCFHTCQWLVFLGNGKLAVLSKVCFNFLSFQNHKTAQAFCLLVVLEWEFKNHLRAVFRKRFASRRSSFYKFDF